MTRLTKNAPANRLGRIPFHRSGFTTLALRATVTVSAVAGSLGRITRYGH